MKSGEQMKTISNKTFDEERALYGEADLTVSNCSFEGVADGESAFKECRSITIDNCRFALRYPFWHNDGLTISNSEMYETCRAPLWYSEHIYINNCKLHGVKALRECSDVKLECCSIVSPEFGWLVDGATVERCCVEGEYMFMRSSELFFSHFEMKGKYSFQYIENASFENCTLDTKDAFWHARSVSLKNCTVKGEYLGWYSEDLTLESCTIIGTQPLCYCKGLKLINCEMLDCDLAFEKSEVTAVLTKPIVSIKNPLSGCITVPSAGSVIMDEAWALGKVIQTQAK